MPLNHDTATASISVSGIALGCINSQTLKWELVFVREPAHTLTIEIIKHTEGGTEQVFPMTLIPIGCEITIEATEAIAPDKPLYLPDEQGDPEDFRLILDIEKRVYQGQKIDLKKPELDVTEMTVSSALLYSVADKLSDLPVELIDNGGMQAARLGKIGTVVGADITCADGGSVLVSVNGRGGFALPPLPHAAVTRYCVILDNTCPPPSDDPEERTVARTRSARAVTSVRKLSPIGRELAIHSDFELYYSILDERGKGKFDLRIDDPDRGPNAICNPSHLGLTTRMFPLPTS